VLICEIADTNTPTRGVTFRPAAAGGELHFIWVIVVGLREGWDATEHQAEGKLQDS
jgi:hypothetical protein